MSLTKTQRWAIGADLSIIRAMGFNHIRVLTFTTGGDPDYAPWPKANFLSFPTPTADELANFGEFLVMTKDFGMTIEVVLLMADHANLYYQNGVKEGDYLTFINSLWVPMWSGALDRIYLGGDLRLGDHDDPAFTASHRQWITDLWPHLVSLCPGCEMGMEVQCQGSTSFWDRGADSLAWIRANLTARSPSFVGGSLYPTSHAALKVLEFENSAGVVDWSALTVDWITGMRAAAGPIPVFADEVGMNLAPLVPHTPPEFTPADQAAFLAAAYGAFNAKGMMANVWELADHPAIGDFGLLTTKRGVRQAVGKLAAPLSAARAAGLRPGICYTPPEFANLAWLMPS